jgi:hypothetical protein
MQTLTFNTTTKQVQLLNSERDNSKVLESFNNVSTVKCSEFGFYEVMQKLSEDSISAVPVLRVPIANTNMIIMK